MINCFFMKRLFIAINILPQQELLKVYNEVKKRCYAGKIKWVDTELFHLTLKFLGDTQEDLIESVSNVLDKISNETDCFTFDIKGLGIFGSSYRPRIIRADIENDKSLKILGNSILSGLEKIGFSRDRQNFVPHITLGRIKYVQDKRLLQEVISEFSTHF